MAPERRLRSRSRSRSRHRGLGGESAGSDDEPQRSLSVAIVGGGLAGLALARALQLRSRQAEAQTEDPGSTGTLCGVTVFERESVVKSLQQQHLQLDARGASALKALGLWKEWLEIAEEQARDGHGWARRNKLLALLASSLEPGSLQLGRGVVGVALGSRGGLRCLFADGVAEGPFDLVVAADGLYSRFSTEAHLTGRLVAIGDALRPFAHESPVGAVGRVRGGGNRALSESLDFARLLAREARKMSGRSSLQNGDDGSQLVQALAPFQPPQSLVRSVAGAARRLLRCCFRRQDSTFALAAKVAN
eukprot:TRINITY_DN28500_c0_g1_i2.p1 TRINITY_DN28500_c0_g1~~TRINITY_DN28500_c0_g1_i2.p1  ORF type:complete len:321 (-),score=72.37 TRINITY_DN28500_c0_g1_i2:308-1222(-)